MICPVSGLYYHVIHIDLDISMHHIMEQSSSNSLISGSCILQPKWHNPVSVSTPLSNERSLLHILWSHQNLIIPRKSIHEGLHQMPCSAINQHINVWKGKIILRALFRSRKSIQTLTLLSFLGTGTTLASHSGYSTADKKPTLSCF